MNFILFVSLTPPKEALHAKKFNNFLHAIKRLYVIKLTLANHFFF